MHVRACVCLCGLRCCSLVMTQDDCESAIATLAVRDRLSNLFGLLIAERKA
jgi:hypothetical protein